MTDRDPTSSAVPPLGALPDPVSTFRQLPTPKTVQGTAHKSVLNQPFPAPYTDADPAGPSAEKAVLEYNEEVLKRLHVIRQQMEEAGEDADPVNPLKDEGFAEFCRSHLAYVNMTYVLSGRFPHDAVHGPMRDSEGRGAPLQEHQHVPGLDPALANNVAAQAAMMDGLDLVSDANDGD